MKKNAVLLYGVTNYLIGSASLVALIAFIFNFLPDNPLLSNIDAASGGSGGAALWINLGLITLFALQHSVMARRSFKQRLARILPAASAHRLLHPVGQGHGPAPGCCGCATCHRTSVRKPRS